MGQVRVISSAVLVFAFIFLNGSTGVRGMHILGSNVVGQIRVTALIRTCHIKLCKEESVRPRQVGGERVMTGKLTAGTQTIFATLPGVCCQALPLELLVWRLDGKEFPSLFRR
jgi:hypothetical protein